jgi:hypothetical protein
MKVRTMSQERQLCDRLIGAVRRHDLAALEGALADGADANTRDGGGGYGETAVGLAMAEGFAAGVGVLLAHGADPALYYLPSGGPEFRSAFADAEDWIEDPREHDQGVKEAARLILQTGRRPTGPPPDRDPSPARRRRWWRCW